MNHQPTERAQPLCTACTHPAYPNWRLPTLCYAPSTVHGEAGLGSPLVDLRWVLRWATAPAPFFRVLWLLNFKIRLFNPKTLLTLAATTYRRSCFINSKPSTLLTPASAWVALVPQCLLRFQPGSSLVEVRGWLTLHFPPRMVVDGGPPIAARFFLA